MRMQKAFFLLLCVYICSTLAHAAQIRIGDGDCAALAAAIGTSSRNGPPVSIMLHPRGFYANCYFAIGGNVSIDGQGAILSLASSNGNLGSSTPQIQVEQGGDLSLRNLKLQTDQATAIDAQAKADPTPDFFGIYNLSPAITVSGSLSMDSVSLSGIYYACGVAIVLIVCPGLVSIADTGNGSFRNVSIVNNTMFGTMADSALIRNAGKLEIYQSTLAWNTMGSGASIVGGPATIANSIIAGNNARACSQPATSQGGNIVTDSSCTLGGPNDRVVANAAFGAFADNGGLSNTLAIRDYSPAVGNGIAAFCEAADARGEARPANCDSGAFQYGGGRSKLELGGMNGLFFDPAADGHYVLIQRVGDSNAVVFWNAFDRQGNPSWIYAFGDVNGKSLHTQASQNLGGVLQIGGAAIGAHGHAWGTIDIDFSDCANASLRYSSSQAEFGSGTFPLRRIAGIGGLECAN